jgi:predicted  nucleic acid-binding Zn-ribbon protein
MTEVNLEKRLAEAQATIRALQEELKETQRGLLALTLELEQRVDERTRELRASNAELTRFNEAMVGRELRMIELKHEVNELCARLGQPRRYGLGSKAEKP